MWDIIAIEIATNGRGSEDGSDDARREPGKGRGQCREKVGDDRSAFTREALRSALKTVQVRELESRQREGYKRKPVKRGEFTDWNRNRFGVIDEERRGPMVPVLPTRQEATGCNSY